VFIFEFLYSSLVTIAAGAGVILLLAMIYKRDAIHWQYLADQYGREWRAPIRERWGNGNLYGKFPLSRGYNGILKVGVFPNGFALKIAIPPDSLFCDPLFIPFEDVRGWDQTWYINSKTVELELVRAPEVKLVMPKSQLEWIHQNSGGRIRFENVPSPNNAKPVLWYWTMIVSFTLPIVGMGTFWFVKFLFG